MRKTFLLLAFACLQLVAHAQNVIAVQHGSSPTFYSNLDSAITHAQNRDTIYIPGGAYTTNQLIIDKELHLIGVGHNPDSTNATGKTILNANIILVSGANNSSFEGFHLFGFISCGTNVQNEDVDNVAISRCHTQTLSLSRLSTNWSITENIIDGYLYGFSQSNSSPYTQSNYFSNNIIGGQVLCFATNNEFRNNIFLFNPGNDCTFYNISNCIFENNVFLNGNCLFPNGPPFCTANNNLFIINFLIPENWTGSNNIINQISTSIFVNLISYSFSYTADYHLQISSPGHNAGTDGKDIGIYGGNYPWKAGSVPFNPHIISKTISGTTDANGNINVNIKVEAQKN